MDGQLTGRFRDRFSCGDAEDAKWRSGREGGAARVARWAGLRRRPDVAVPQLPDSSHEGTKARRSGMGSVWDGVLKSRRLAPSPKNEIHVASFAPLRETLPRSSSRHAATARRHRGTGSMNLRPEGAKTPEPGATHCAQVWKTSFALKGQNQFQTTFASDGDRMSPHREQGFDAEAPRKRRGKWGGEGGCGSRTLRVASLNAP